MPETLSVVGASMSATEREILIHLAVAMAAGACIGIDPDPS